MYTLGYLHSSSTMVTVAVSGLSRMTPTGNEAALIVRLKVSSNSALLSSTMLTVNEVLKEPLLNVAVYGPET